MYIYKLLLWLNGGFSSFVQDSEMDTAFTNPFSVWLQTRLISSGRELAGFMTWRWIGL